MAFTLLFGAWSLLLLAWLTLQWGIVPRVGQWKPEIEQRASAALGVPVTIGAIRVRSSGWVPLIELDDVVLAPRPAQSGPGGGEALRLPRVSAALSARSILGLELRFEQLHVEGASLEVRRDAAGRLFIAGIEVRAGTADDDEQGAGTDWLLAQREVAVRHGRVRWIDEQRGAPPLELADVDFVLRNGLARHDMRLDATPPADVGARFTLIGRFTQPLLSQRSNWRRWHGAAYAELPRADVVALRQLLPVLPLQIEAGEGAVRAWMDVRDGRPRAALADVALRHVALRFPGREQALTVEHLQGRVSASRDGRLWRFGAERLAFASGDIEWPATRLALALRESEAAPAAASASAPTLPFDGGELSADRLDLAPLARLASQLPLGDAVDKLLAELAPSGQVRELSARWEGPLDAPRRYQLKAQAAGLSIAAAPAAEPGHLGRPGWRNASLELDASEAGGRARLAIDQGALIVPGVFEQPEVALDRFSTRLAWRLTPQAGGAPPMVEVSLADTQFANADAQGQLTTAQWRTGAGAGSGRGARFPGQLDLAGQLSRGRAAAVATYLPLGVPESVRQYVQHAVTDGRVTGATFKVKGDLWDFPFVPTATAGAKPAPASGEFRIVGKVEDVALTYVPGGDGAPSAWPAFSGVAGDLVFDRTSMEIRNASARLWGVELSKVNGGIRDLGHSVLRLDGQVRGPAGDMLRYVNSTPVGAWTGQALREASAGGSTELKLALELPLADLDRSTVQGSVLLAGNDLRLTPGAPLLGNAKARIGFTQKALTVAGGSARVLGGDTSFEGGSQADGTLRFTAQGVATADGVRRAGELGGLSRLAALTSGQAPYRLALGVVRGHTEVTLTSSLAGLAIDLPTPLRKPAEAAWPLRIESRVAPDSASRDTLRVELGNVITAQYQREAGADGSLQPVRGAIGVLEPAPPLPERGVHAVLALGAVDADAWQAALAKVQGPAGTSPGTAEDGYLPRTVALRAQALSSEGRRLTNLVAGVSQDAADGTWRGSLDADQLGGYVEYRAGRGPAAPGRVYARLARLALPPSDASSVENLLADAPSTVPALDIVIDNFELRGKKLGRVEVEAVNRGPREWRMTRFVLTNPEAQLTGTGQWQAGGAAAQRMVMDFKLDLADSGAFLDRLGFPGTLRGGKGHMGGQVSWAGSPLAFHVPSLDGKLDLSIENGQFLKAGPGAGRLLSVLSLQSLPRRLVLDFRDLFQEGFAFDNVSGDVTINDGVAATRNLRMRGVQAAVLMEGHADLQRETQNLRVVVVPEINAGTASLAYAAINPAIGLGTFLAQMFLRRPLMAASTREFTVQGSWDEPKIERVERKPGEPIPEFDAAPSAPAGAPAPKPAS
ncbi:MAG TPA: YhdP family protein [Burkholderiaceae bacterium]|nr:YhdP family protein [Burkholderiaceae bacterium]